MEDLLPGAQSFLGEAATAERLRSDAPDARLIHLATHGLFRQDNPLFSSIRLGDTRLCLFDLYDLTLRAQLVTLSGCCTGLGSIAAGDELVGLTRGLLFAGARGVQVTLWQVHNESTTLYMAQFYRHCAAGASPLEASQQALLALRAVRPHPYYWAPYITKAAFRLKCRWIPCWNWEVSTCRSKHNPKLYGNITTMKRSFAAIILLLLMLASGGQAAEYILRVPAGKLSATLSRYGLSVLDRVST